MSICSALALFLVVGQGADVPLKVGDKEIPLRLVSSPVIPPPPDYLAWDGWQYLASAPTKVWEPYPAASKWGEILPKYEAAKALKRNVWRSKVFVITRTESTQRDAAGVLRSNRDFLSEKQLQETLEAIARVRALITAEFGGKVVFEPDVEVELDTLRWNSYGNDFAQWYLGPRINGGLYVAEDKVFRGPYNSALYILPGYSDAPPARSVVNGTPVAGVYANAPGMSAEAGRLEIALREALLQQVQERLKEQGFGVGAGSSAAVDAWQTATSIEQPSTDVLLQRLRDAKNVSLVSELALPLSAHWKAPGTDVAIVDDPEHGRVLQVKENPAFRTGGVALPVGAEPIGTLEKTPTLSFFAKSTDHDPISIRVQGKSSSFCVSVGRDPAVAQASNAVVGSAPFQDDGQWQKVSVDLRPLAKAAGVNEIVSLAIEPSPNALVADMLEFGNGEYYFDDIKLSSEAATPLLTSPIPDLSSLDGEARALAASKATESSPALIAALKDPLPVVRLNAAAAYTKIKDPLAESALTFDMSDFNAPIQEQALFALAFQGTDSAKASIRQAVRFTLGDLAKGTGAKLLAETGDAKYTGDILLLFTNPSWQSAMTAVEALAKLPGVNPQARHVFLRSLNPALRLVVVRLADAKNTSDRGALEWHALNDPSDMVRAHAHMKLIESGDPVVAAEGYKGVRDDSRYARILLLDLLAASPKAEHRPAIMIGLADNSPLVRAAAARALAAQPAPVPLEELGTLVEDRHPEVLLALSELAVKKALKLPSSTVAAMKDTPDKRVQDAAKGLQG